MNQHTQQLLTDAYDALRHGKISSARIMLNKIFRKNPESIDGLILGAHVERVQLHFDIARQYLIKVLKQDDISITHLKMLAQQLSQLELHFLLAEALKQLDKMEPNNPKIIFQLGLCLARIGKIDQAITALQECLRLDNSNHLAILNLGHVHKAKGQSPLAAEQYQKFIQLQPSMLGTGYWSLADLKDYRFSEQDVLAIQQAMDKSHSIITDKKEIGLLSFAMARAKEQAKDVTSSFKYLQAANQQISQTRPFKLAGYQHIIETQLDYRPEHINSTSLAADAPTPIFIVGMPRSGTTLTEQILASHSDIGCTDELPFIERIAMQLSKGKSYIEGITTMTRQQREHFADYYLQQVEEYTGNKHALFIDKNPTNFIHIALIKALFPNAKIIALLRDPLDNVLSVYKQHFSKGNDFSYQLGHIVDYTAGYISLLKHWKAVYGDQIYHLSYQSLVTSPEQSIRNLLDFCGVDFQPQCLEFHTSDRPVLTPSVSQVRQPITTKALGSGKMYRPYISDFERRIEQLTNKMASL
ncbi:tetratricopeptide repeat-containing sulfotransferase family protein [Aliiglaciecola sp. LCG003]|uniref:tetratricopeptide repeat-containing sulfotransferase family protein n=1 Tax=Aliiglaciecola sp. LCG003 TaxID=3053655 RepID=UPI002572A6F9|nr:tetratricopeptide repeat-containing sulfotransferase family protein [Aliiglaciecola sp. LCG003]WJG08352.1 sulfotransferase [Aliiglaciecola sp. LCG003]